jgi:GT2 family glycosyltransferase
MKVSVIILIYNSRRYIKGLFGSLMSQTHKDLEVIAVINSSNDGSKEEIVNHYASVKIIDPGENLWFCKGNNLGIRSSSGEIIFALNDDVVLEPDYIEKALNAFKDPKVGAVTGKILRYDFNENRKLKIIDSTGIIFSSSGRGRDRGQLEEDKGQYDSAKEVFGVSGAVAMYRRSALEQIKFCDSSKCEYFDEDFVAYWEDLDLSWRLNLAGYKNVFEPQAMAYHGRTAGQAKGGYLRLINFIKHHRKLPKQVLRANFRNHILAYVKNAPYIHPRFALREFAMFFYILVFETGTLKEIPNIIRLVPRMRRKRNDFKKRTAPKLQSAV